MKKIENVDQMWKAESRCQEGLTGTGHGETTGEESSVTWVLNENEHTENNFPLFIAPEPCKCI